MTKGARVDDRRSCEIDATMTANPNDMTVADAACAYASTEGLGVPVFPVSPWSKRPYANPPGVPQGRGGFYLATRDPVEIRHQFEVEHPEAMVAMRTDGYLVIDFDPDPTCGYNQCLEDWAEPDDFPETLRSRSARGGDHFFYRLPDGVDLGPTQSVIGSYVDTRSYRSYIVLAPSVLVDGRRYLWVNWGVPIAPAPERWIAYLLAHAGSRGQDAGPPVDFSTLTFPERPTRYAGKALENLCAETAAAVQGTRHTRLLHAAERMGRLIAGRQIDPRTARAALVAAGRGCGLEEPEIGRVIADGFRYGSTRPQPLVAPELQAWAMRPGADVHPTE